MLGYEEIELDNEEISFSILNGEKSQDGPSNKTNTTKATDKCTTVTAKTDAKNVKSLMSQLKTLNVTSSKVFSKKNKKGPKKPQQLDLYTSRVTVKSTLSVNSVTVSIPKLGQVIALKSDRN